MVTRIMVMEIKHIFFDFFFGEHQKLSYLKKEKKNNFQNIQLKRVKNYYYL